MHDNKGSSERASRLLKVYNRAHWLVFERATGLLLLVIGAVRLVTLGLDNIAGWVLTVIGVVILVRAELFAKKVTSILDESAN